MAEDDPVEEAGGGDQAGEVPAGPPPNMMHVTIEAARGLPEECATVVSYKYSMLTEEQEEAAMAAAAEQGEDEKPLGVVEGKTAEFEEPPAGTEHKYNLKQSYVLPPTTDLLLYRFITMPMEFKVEGLAVPGKVQIPLQDLVWRPDPKPEDPDEDDFLPDAPGSFIVGWFRIVPEEPLEEGQTFPEKAEVYIRLQISETLLPKEELATLNIVTFTIESMHRLPQLWRPGPEAPVGEDHEYVYKLRYKLPGAEADAFVDFNIEPGELSAAEPAPAPPEVDAEGGQQEEGDKAPEGAFEAEPGEEPAPEGANAQQKEEVVAKAEEEEELAYVQRTGSRVDVKEERKGAKIKFAHTTSIAMQASAVYRLRKMISTRNDLQIDLVRELRSGEDYVYKKKYHGRIFLDADALLEAGATSVDMRCAVEPADDFAMPTEEELEATPPPGGEAEPDNEGGANPYLLDETYIKVAIKTMRPLVQKPKPPPPVLPKVQDLLPTRAPVPKHAPPMSGSQQFGQEVEGIIQELADTYHALFLEQPSSDVTLAPSEVDARRQTAIFELNKSGRYYDFKERLKRSTLRIVRERFYKEGLDPTSEDGKRVMSKLYIELQDLINLRLNAAFSPPKKPSATGKASEMAKYIADELRLAEEAQVSLDFPLASSHLNTRIIASPADATVWYDYGVLCVRNGQGAKAEECLREALMLDPRYTAALLTYGVLLCKLDRFAEAETYFLGATNFSPDDVLAWSMLMLFYDMESKDMERRAAVKKVLLLDKASGTRRSPYLRAAVFCTELLAVQLVERAATQQVVKHGDSQELQLILARAYMNVAQYDRARKILGPNDDKSGVLDKDKRCAVAMTLLGHVLYLQLRWHKLRSDVRDSPPHKDVLFWFEKAMAQKEPFSEVLSLVRMARLYLWVGKHYEAKDVLIKACRLTPSATTWLGLGIACYHLKQVDEAEQALCEVSRPSAEQPRPIALLPFLHLRTWVQLASVWPWQALTRSLAAHAVV